MANANNPSTGFVFEIEPAHIHPDDEPLEFVRVEHVHGVHRLHCPGCDAHVETLTPAAYAEACEAGELTERARCSWCTRDDLIPGAPAPAVLTGGGVEVQCPTCKVRSGGVLNVEQLHDAAARGNLEAVCECADCSLRGIV